MQVSAELPKAPSITTPLEGLIFSANKDYATAQECLDPKNLLNTPWGKAFPALTENRSPQSSLLGTWSTLRANDATDSMNEIVRKGEQLRAQYESLFKWTDSPTPTRRQEDSQKVKPRIDANPVTAATQRPLTSQVVPVSHAIETNKLLRQLIGVTAEKRDRDSRDLSQEFRRVSTENADLRVRIAKLEEERETTKTLDARLKNVESILGAMYYDLGSVAALAKDIRESLGGPPLDMPPVDDIDEIDGELEEPED